MPGLLAFHAHPDDETLSTGGSLARYGEKGEQTVVVTATDGAVGEIHNFDNPEEIFPRLAELRAEEMAAAARVLGLTHHEFLGYRDSGMMGTDDNQHKDSFWQADFMEATTRLVRLLRRYTPDVMTIYDPFGGYGHPDHIQVHRVGLAAAAGALDLGRFPLEDGEEPWAPTKLYWAAWPRSRVRLMVDSRLRLGDLTEEEAERARAGGTPDEDITAWIDVGPWVDRKLDALRAHRSQIPGDWWLLTAAEGFEADVFGRESFVRVFTRVEALLREDDLFSGLR